MIPSPVVIPSIIDMTGGVPGPGATIAAAVFKSNKGRVNEPVLCTSAEQFIAEFGTPVESVSDAHEMLQPYLRTAPVWALRVDNGSKYSHASLYNLQDYNSGETVSTTYDSFFPAASLDASAAAAFLTGGYEDGEFGIQVIEFQGALIASNVLTAEYSIGGGASAITVSVTYATSNAATLAAFATALQTSLRTNVGNANITVDVLTVSTTNSSGYIRIMSPQGVDLPILSEVEITLGVSQAVVLYWPEPKLFDIFAISPGVWGDDVGYRVRDIKYGSPAASKVTLAGFLTTSNTANISINGVALSSAVTYDTSHKATMDLLMAALRAKFGPLGYYFKFGAQTWENALGTSPSASGVNELEIHVRSTHFGEDFTLTAAMGGGASAATITALAAATTPTGEFTLEIFLREDSSSPVESHTVTIHERVDGNGYQTNIENVINEGPNASRYVRVVQPSYSKYLSSGIAHLRGSWRDSAKTILDMHSTVQWLGNGAAGSAVTDTMIATAWDTFLDKTRYNVKILINCGYSNVTVHKKMLEVAKTRRNCTAFLDAPVASQATSALMEYRNFILGVDNSYGTLVSPNIKTVSQYSPGGRFIPPSGHFAAQAAANDHNNAIWRSFAGLNYGILDGITDTYVDYSKSDLDLLCPIGISPIIIKNGAVLIWDLRTLQRRQSALSSLPVRRIVSEVEDVISKHCESFLQDPTDSNTRFKLVQGIETYLRQIQIGRGIKFFFVKSDTDNNKEADEAVGRINVDIYIHFIQAAREIRLRTIIIDGTVTFQELGRQAA